MPLNYQPLPLAQVVLLLMENQWMILVVARFLAQVMSKPPMPAAMSDNSMALVLSFLPNTTYDLPWCDLPFGSLTP
jgi:flagellar biosynthesis protein FliP